LTGESRLGSIEKRGPSIHLVEKMMALKAMRRNFKVDPWIDDDETLEIADYREAHSELGMDRGHQALLASFKGADVWQETNCLSNITPQRSDLNQGPWREWGDSVRDLVEAEGVGYVMTGPLYEREMGIFTKRG
jgi:endonuclease G